MSKIGYKLLATTKGSPERQIYVIHRHKGSDFQRATGVAVVPTYFDSKSGTVSKLPQAPEYNRVIRRVVGMMEAAARNLVGKGVEPLKPAMTSEYQRVQKKWDDWDAFKKTEPPLHVMQANAMAELYAELAELEAAVAECKERIEFHASLSPDYVPAKLLASYVREYRVAREPTLKPNSLRLFDNVAEWVAKFNPTWQITEVNTESLRAFQNFLLAAGKGSTTVADIITKTKSVVFYYARSLKLDVSEVKEFRLDFKKKKNANVIYLTREELTALIALPIDKPTERVVRDQFVVMCLTGVRFSDSRLTRDHIVNGQIRVSTEKTDADVFIPLAPKVREILETHDYNFKYVPASNFNKYIKTICSRIPALAERKELVKTYAGGKITKKYVSKDKLITCHVGRKTFINLALERGVNPVAIANIVGHEGTQLIMGVYGSSQAGREAIGEIWG